MQILAAIIKCLYAHLSQLHAFVGNEIQHLPNPQFISHLKPPMGQVPKWSYFHWAKKKSRQPELFVFKFHDQLIYIVKITYSTFFLVKMDITHPQDKRNDVL